MGKNRSLSARIAGFDHQVEDQAARPVVRLSLWPYSTSRPPLMMSVCGSNRLTIFSLPQRLALKNATLGLPDDPLDQRAIAAELGLPQRRHNGCHGAPAITAPRPDRHRPGSPGPV